VEDANGGRRIKVGKTRTQTNWRLRIIATTDIEPHSDEEVEKDEGGDRTPEKRWGSTTRREF